MAISFLQQFDTTLKTVLYDRFKDIMGLERDPEDIDENINIGVIQMPRNIATRWHAEKLGQNSLEFISLWRESIEFAWKRQRTPIARRGMMITHPDDSDIVYNIKAAPVDMIYEVCIWSVDLDRIYKCIERYAFWQHENPQFSITYGDVYTIKPDMHFGAIRDDSTVPEEFDKGAVFCYRFPLHVDGWVLQDEDMSGVLIYKIETTIYDSSELGTRYTMVTGDPPDDPELEAAVRMQRSLLYGVWSTSPSRTITLYTDYTSEFSPGDRILIVESSDNSGRYTINNVETVDEATVLTVDEDIVASTGTKGYVYRLDT